MENSERKLLIFAGVILILLLVLSLALAGYLVYDNRQLRNTGQTTLQIEQSMSKIENKLSDLQNVYKEAKERAYVSSLEIEREVSALTPDAVAIELDAMLADYRSARSDSIRSGGLDNSR